MNIYDCFMYFDEDLLLDLRLHSLNKFVKKFVITEATYTHNGTKKKLNFDINKFKKFKDKIIYIVVDRQPENIINILNNDSKDKKGEKLILNGMARDYFQRENLNRGIKEAEDNDLVLISDLDEIPNLDQLEVSRVKNNIIIFEQKMFYYKLNLYYKLIPWFGSKACKKKYFKSAKWVQWIKNKKYPLWRIDIIYSKRKYNNIFYIHNGGWHFTNVKSPRDIEKKLLNYTHHYEFEQSGLTSKDLEKKILEKKVIYDHGVDQREFKWGSEKKLQKINKSNLPKYLRENLDKYTNWLE